MDYVLKVSSRIIAQDKHNMVCWIYLDKNPGNMTESEKHLYRKQINYEINSILDSQVPNEFDSIFTLSTRSQPKFRIFIEKENDLSQILWIEWKEEDR